MKNFLLPVLVVGLIIVTIACDKMRTIIDQLGSLRGANTENNRVWAREDSHRDKLIVFVHGFNSSNATAWGEFPSLMQKDERFEDFNLVLYGYPTKCGSVDSIREEGSSLASFLNDILEGNRPNYSRIILVGHSMGGLVVMNALLNLERDHFPVLTKQDLRVVTFGTPYMGVENTDLLPPFCTNKQTENMVALNNGLHELGQEWNQRFNQELSTVGKPTPQVPLYTFHGREDKFVSKASACMRAKIPCEIVDGDHYSIVKPITREHLSYTRLLVISLESQESQQQASTTQPQSKPEIIVQGVMPIHIGKQHKFGKTLFLDRQLGFIMKVYNPSVASKTVEVFIVEGCVPFNLWMTGESFIDRGLLPEPITFNDEFAALMRTAVQKIRVSGAVRPDSRVLEAGGVGYVGVSLPLPLGRSGASLVVEDSASLRGHCFKIPRPTTQPSIDQLLSLGPLRHSEPKDIAQSFRDGSLKMTLQVSGKKLIIPPSSLGKLYSFTWDTWRSLDLARMYEVPDTDFPPTLDTDK